MKGRKRHLLVDTLGFALKVVVTGADEGDRDGARLVAQAVNTYGPDLPRLTKVWADSGYTGSLADDLHAQMGWNLAIVKRSDEQPQGTFAVQPHRWIVERTFAWWNGFRRLAKDYETQVESSEALIYVGMTHLMLRRVARLDSASLRSSA